MKEITEHEAMLRLSSLCSTAEHCSFEMTEKMRKWNMTDEAQAHVMEYLTKNKFVDDERFAHYFVKDKLKYNKWGRRKIQQAMWMKRIDDSTQQMALGEISEDEYIKVLRPLIKSKRKSIKADSDYEANMKLIRFAIGRGFDMDVIRKCMDVGEDIDIIDEDKFME